MSSIPKKPGGAARRALLWLALSPLPLVACQVPDTSGADATWSPKGTNAANLAVMVADPADLMRGHDDAGPDHKLAAHAVIQLWTEPAGASAGSASGGGASANAASGGGASGGGASAGAASGGAAGTGAGN